ncbi:GNAT family N-acetyltransferase [Liquorilactobacillus mali]|uniref:GNAT family N-acetyltransferase n=1 Tax=Liquorilactobacillus mali TaxID=1618 RepID=UPI0026567C23|nr:GNAT family N-acetyltransferase [Liquorilactobacillus mali]MDN7144946.1 GNAT family N-acetyltransferase [Liquorilactobacillus mali]
MEKLEIKVGAFDYLRASSCYVRMSVFVLERDLSLEDEFDNNDRETTIYSVIFSNKKPISTARFLPLDEDIVRITRVATLKEYRGKKLGTKVVRSLENIAQQKNFKKIVIHSEMTAVTFYETLGYVRSGDIYQEDGVACVNLIKTID